MTATSIIFPRTLAEASVQLNGDSPVQEFIVNLQELLKNCQLVDKSFAFCLVKENGQDKKIQDPSGIPTNMALLCVYFKISSSKGRDSFEKQKVWKNNKEVKVKVQNPTIYFFFAFATDEDPANLLARVSHEWHRPGGICLKVKELQTFKSKTVVCLFNIFTSTPKKMILFEFQEILERAQRVAQDQDPTDFFFNYNDLPVHSSLPALKLSLMNPKLPGQDTSHFNRLSWQTQVNRKIYHVECDIPYSTEIKCLIQLAKDVGRSVPVHQLAYH